MSLDTKLADDEEEVDRVLDMNGLVFVRVPGVSIDVDVTGEDEKTDIMGEST